MLKQSITDTICIHVSPNASIDVVIHFHIAYAILRNEPMQDLVGVCSYLGVTEVKLIASMINDAFAVATEEPVIGHFTGKRTVDAYHLQFHPESRNHSPFFNG